MDDGHFAPPISIGALVADARATSCTEREGVLEVHLIVERAERRVDEFAAAGAKSIAVG